MESGTKRQCDEEPERSPLEKRMRLEEKIRLLNGGGVPMLSPALPSTPPSSHPALDRDSFRARLSSFAPTLWPAFHPVTPVDCAQRGFRLEEADLVRCVACPAALSGRLASSDVTGARERSVEALRKNLVARHTRFCPFSSMASSPAFADPLLDSTSLFEDFLTSVKSMERFGRAVPRFTERTVSRIAGARSHLVEYVLKQVRCGDQKEDDEEDIWKSRIVLALTGWELGGCGDSTTIKCDVCNRKRGAWECHTFETPLPSNSNSAVEIFPAESEEIVAETVEEVVLEEVATLASEALSDARLAEEEEGAEKDTAEEKDTGPTAIEDEAVEDNDNGSDSDEDSGEYVGKKHKALQRSDEQDDRSSEKDDEMEDGSERASAPKSVSKATSEVSSTRGSLDGDRDEILDGAAGMEPPEEGDVAEESDVAEEGEVEPREHHRRDDQIEDDEVPPEADDDDEEEEEAESRGPRRADKEKEKPKESEQEEVESEGDHDEEAGETREGGHSEIQIEVTTKPKDGDGEDDSSQEEIVLPGRAIGINAVSEDESDVADSSQEEVVLPGSAIMTEEADEDESDGADDGSQEDIPEDSIIRRSIIRLAMGKFGPDRDRTLDGTGRNCFDSQGNDVGRGPNWGNPPEGEMEGEEEEEEEEEESEPPSPDYEDDDKEVADPRPGHYNDDDDDDDGESADDRPGHYNDDCDDGESSDDVEGSVPALNPKFASKSAAPPAADSDSDVICLSSDDDDDEQENLREAADATGSTEDPSSDQTTPSTPMNSTMEEEEEEEEEGESTAELGTSTVEVGNSTVEVGNSTIDKDNSTVEVHSSTIVLETSAEEERVSSPIPNLDGAFDLLPEKAPTPPRKFFNPLDHLPWCMWVRPTSFDQSVTGASALAIRLGHLVVKAGAGVEEQSVTGSVMSPSAVNGICKLTPEAKLKKVREALDESYN